MNRLLYCSLCVACLILSSGCRAPMPTFRSSHLLSPFGSTKVPPPATKSLSAVQGYNSHGPASANTNNAAASGWRTATRTSDAATSQNPNSDTRLIPQANSSAPATPASPSNRLAGTTTTSPVQPAAYVTTSGTSGQNRTIGTGASAVQLKGMHVNDATSSNEPGAFVESSSFSEIPAATSSDTPNPQAAIPQAAITPDTAPNATNPDPSSPNPGTVSTPTTASTDAVSVTANAMSTASELNWRGRGA